MIKLDRLTFLCRARWAELLNTNFNVEIFVLRAFVHDIINLQ